MRSCFSSRSRHSLAFCLCAVLCFLLAGCSLFSPSQHSTPPAPDRSAAGRAQPEIAKATEQNWNKLLTQWWQAWQKSTTVKPQQQSTPASNLPLVTIDLGALATRHPAWRLASALETNRTSTLDFAAIEAAGVSIPSLREPSFDVSLRSDADVETNAGTPALPDEIPTFVTGYEHEAETVTAQGMEALHAQARDQQSDTIEVFLRAVATQQLDAREHYTQIRHVAIESEVELARNTPLPEIEPPLLSAEDQLLITNLRLRLQTNLFASEEERQRVQNQLDEILDQWRARLRRQEQEQLLELQRRREELPQQAREIGEAELRADLDRLQREQRSLLRLVWQEHQRRVRQEFGDDALRLGIVLPAASLPAQALDLPDTSPEALPAEIFGTGANILETNLESLASQPAFSSAVSGVSAVATPDATRISLNAQERSTLIRALRSQAWREARKQAQWAARRFGWRWQPASGSNTSAPNRTQEVLQWLSN